LAVKALFPRTPFLGREGHMSGYPTYQALTKYRFFACVLCCGTTGNASVSNKGEYSYLHAGTFAICSIVSALPFATCARSTGFAVQERGKQRASRNQTRKASIVARPLFGNHHQARKPLKISYLFDAYAIRRCRNLLLRDPSQKCSGVERTRKLDSRLRMVGCHPLRRKNAFTGKRGTEYLLYR
jgi:hypothetical protein